MLTKIFNIRLALASILVSGLALFPNSSFAHVRWFIDSKNPGVVDFQPFTFSDPVVLIWTAIALVLIAIAIFLDGKIPKIPVVSSKIRHDVMELMRIFVGMSFLLTAYEGALIAPHLVAHGGFGLILVFLQAVIGILLISNHFLRHAAILILILMIGVTIQFGFVSALEYCNFIGIALFLLFNDMPTKELQDRFKPYSVDALRIFTGLALVILGVTEKLHGAVLGQAFIELYQWNFMQTLGIEFFTDRVFVLSAGVMEVVFGTIMILGVVTRLNTLVVAGFMLTSNIVFLVQNARDEALTELIGHMPVIATAVILLFLGSGQRLKITTLFARSKS